MKKKNLKENENLFQIIDDDPRLASAVEVEQTIDSDIESLFTVVGTSDEKIEKLDATPYSYWSLTFKYLFKNPFVIVCLVILALLIFFTIFGPLMKYYPPLKKKWVYGPHQNITGTKLLGGLLNTGSVPYSRMVMKTLKALICGTLSGKAANYH